MDKFIVLSKNLNDPYLERFSRGLPNAKLIDQNNFDYDKHDGIIVFRGLTKRRLMERCKKDGREFWYVDTGYFGNYRSSANPMGHKNWHRVVVNDVQNFEIQNKPSDRWSTHNITLEKRKSGNDILLVTPSEKPCKFYGIDLNEWIDTTCKQIEKYTDRKIRIRQKARRQDRVFTNTIFEDLDNDVHCVVTYNSIAATEAVIHGIPAFVQAPNAASQVSNTNLKDLEQPFFPDEKLRLKWVSSLAYSQFHINEMETGKAYKLIRESNEITN